MPDKDRTADYVRHCIRKAGCTCPECDMSASTALANVTRGAMLEALQDRARDQMVALLESVDSSVLMEQVQVSSTSDGFGRWSNHPKQKLVDRPELHEQPRNDPNGTEQTDAIAATSRRFKASLKP